MFNLISSFFVINGLPNHFEQIKDAEFCLLFHLCLNCNHYSSKSVFSMTKYLCFVFLHFKLIMHGSCFRFFSLVKYTFQILILNWCCSFIFFLHSFLTIIAKKNQLFRLNHCLLFSQHLIIDWLNSSAFHQAQHLFRPNTVFWPRSHISSNQRVFRFFLRTKNE